MYEPVQFNSIRDVVHAWDRCRDMLLPALELTHGTHNEDDVLVLLAKGEYQLWRRGESACVGHFVFFPRFKAYNLWLAGCNPGHMAEMLTLEKDVCTWAKKQGCQKIRIGGRKGWEKVFKDATYIGIMMEREL